MPKNGPKTSEKPDSMSLLFYNLLVLTAIIWGIVSGYRRGLTGQVCSLLGVALGAVAAHAFSDEAALWARQVLPGLSSHVGAPFVYSFLGSVAVFALAWLLCSALTGILRSALSVLQVGMLDRLLGCAFGLAKCMIVVSVLFNAIVCIHPQSTLLKHSTDSDGNLVSVAMAVAPEVIGSLSNEELAHLLQLHEARKISMQAAPTGQWQSAAEENPRFHCKSENINISPFRNVLNKDCARRGTFREIATRRCPTSAHRAEPEHPSNGATA